MLRVVIALLAWPKVCHPVELGGLGISNVQNLNWALRMRWIWLQKTEANQLWSVFTIQVHDCVQVFFFHGSSVRNWQWHLHIILDCWLHGQCIADLAPRLFSLVPKRKS